MESAKNQREVENRLRDALKYDRARVQLGKISRFGLMELSRQRLRPALAESAYIPCPRCHGIGHIRGTESTALHILRIIQEEAMKDNTAQIVAQMPVDVATFLLNEKRNDVLSIETRFKVNVLLVPNRHLETPNYSDRAPAPRRSEPERAAAAVVQTWSSSREQPDLAKQMKEEAKEPRQEAVVKGITPEQPAPVPVAQPAPFADRIAGAGCFRRTGSTRCSAGSARSLSLLRRRHRKRRSSPRRRAMGAATADEVSLEDVPTASDATSVAVTGGRASRSGARRESAQGRTARASAGSGRPPRGSAQGAC